MAGHTHQSAEKNLLRCSWSHDDTLVTSGSADKMGYVWNVQNTKLEHRLGGHKGCVNDVKFLLEDRIATASSDKTILISNY